MFGGKIAPPQLILANPSECFLTICKAERHGRKADFGMFLKNCITVVTINKGVIPNDQRREQLALFQDIFFKLLMLGCGMNTTYKLLKSGKIKAMRIGRSWKIPKRAVQEYIIQESHLKSVGW